MCRAGAEAATLLSQTQYIFVVLFTLFRIVVFVIMNGTCNALISCMFVLYKAKIVYFVYFLKMYLFQMCVQEVCQVFVIVIWLISVIHMQFLRMDMNHFPQNPTYTIRASPLKLDQMRPVPNALLVICQIFFNFVINFYKIILDVFVFIVEFQRNLLQQKKSYLIRDRSSIIRLYPLPKFTYTPSLFDSFNF